MSDIPRDIYERVHELAVAIVNAAQAGDSALSEAQQSALRDFYNEQTALGRWHPFLTEAMADYTDDPSEAVQLYELALAQAVKIPSEPTHSKMISLASRLIELGRHEQAEAYLLDGRKEALRCKDTDWIEEADDLLGQIQM
jgi:hypothetical protein